MHAIAIRAARPDDAAAIAAMQLRALLALAAGDDAPDTAAALAAHLPALIPGLAASGTLLVAEAGSGQVLGAAGWSRGALDADIRLDRAPAPFPPALDPVGVVRGVFVDPSVARRGLGRRLVTGIEAAMAEAGCVTADLLATRPAELLYRTLGYTALTPHMLRLPCGRGVPLRRMARRLAPADRVAQAA